MITASDESPLVNINAYGIDYDGSVADVNTDNNVVVYQILKWNLQMSSSSIWKTILTPLLMIEIME